MAQNDQNTILNELVEKIQQFFSYQIETNNSLSEAAKESLTVVIECIEQAYNIQKKPASKELADIYKSHKHQPLNRSAGAPQDPTQLITNLASSLFSQVGSGLMGAAARVNTGTGTGTSEQQQTTTSDSQTTSASPSTDAFRPSAPPRQRSNVSESERLAAESFKNRGNDCMKAGQFKEAYDYYTQAIEIDRNNAICYSNRAAASMKLNNNEAALRDCQEAIDIDPNYSKAYGRMGSAYSMMDKHLDAKKAYVKALELDPSNESYRINLLSTEEKLAEQQQTGGAQGSAGSNVAGMLHSMLSNPQVMSMAMQSLQDPRIQNMFGNLGH